MKHIATYTVLCLTFLVFFSAKPIPDGIEYSFQIIENNKEIYTIGDTLSLIIKATQNTRVCAEGVDKTKIFTKGLAIIWQTDWMNTTNNTYEKKITLAVKGNKKNDACITAFRQSDRGIVSQSYSITYTQQ